MLIHTWFPHSGTKLFPVLVYIFDSMMVRLCVYSVMRPTGLIIDVFSVSSLLQDTPQSLGFPLVPQVWPIELTMPAPIHSLYDQFLCLPWWRLKLVGILLFLYELSSVILAFYWQNAWVQLFFCLTMLPRVHREPVLTLFYAFFFGLCSPPTFCLCSERTQLKGSV